MVFYGFFSTPVARAPFPFASSLQHRLVPAPTPGAYDGQVVMTCNDGVRDAQRKKKMEMGVTWVRHFFGGEIGEICQSTLTHSYFFGCAIHIPGVGFFVRL